MQEIEYISCIYCAVLFFCSRKVRYNFMHYLIIKIHNKRQLQNIANNHSADINYKHFMNIYSKCTSDPYSFLTIDSTLPANNSLRFRKNSFRSLIKMILTD